jgi:hypothetical protein
MSPTSESTCAHSSPLPTCTQPAARAVDATSPSPLRLRPCASYAPGPNLRGSSYTRTTRTSRVRMPSLWNSACMARRSTLVPRECLAIARTTGRCGITTVVAMLRARCLATLRRRTRARVRSQHRIRNKGFSKSGTAAARATTSARFQVKEYPHIVFVQPSLVFYLISSHILCSSSL